MRRGYVRIRIAETEDAEKLAGLMKNVDASNFMLFGPGERNLTKERQQQVLESLKLERNSAIFVAEKERDLKGYLAAIGGKAKRARHSAYLVVGVREEARGLGIGTMLFQHLDHWAKNQGIHRLELTVMKNNEAAIALYKKAGFEIEGVKRDSLLVEGVYIDEYYMAKLL
jgi:RimJ/RimL family protein N-acetyltransferase